MANMVAMTVDLGSSARKGRLVGGTQPSRVASGDFH